MESLAPARLVPYSAALEARPENQKNLYNLEIDSHGNIYAAEAQGKRLQKIVCQIGS